MSQQPHSDSIVIERQNVSPPDAADVSTDDARDEAPNGPETALVDEDLLVEEVSIDGMCGVY
jgi:mycofactocin precursor